MRQIFSRKSINRKRRRRCAANDGADGVATTATYHSWCTSAWPTRQRPWPVTPRLRPWRNFGGWSACSRSRPQLIFNSGGMACGKKQLQRDPLDRRTWSRVFRGGVGSTTRIGRAAEQFGRRDVRRRRGRPSSTSRNIAARIRQAGRHVPPRAP